MLRILQVGVGGLRRHLVENGCWQPRSGATYVGLVDVDGAALAAAARQRQTYPPTVAFHSLGAAAQHRRGRRSAVYRPRRHTTRA